MITARVLGVLDLLPERPFLRSAALQDGVSRRVLHELVAAGFLRQPLRGVLVRSDVPDDVAHRAAAAALVLPDGAAACRTTAAWLFGIDARPIGGHGEQPPLECVVPRGFSPVRRPGLRCYTTDLRAADLTQVAGVACVAPARTAIDLARWSSPGVGLATLDTMARRELIDPADLTEQVNRWRGGRFIDLARRLIDWCDPRAESPGESWTRLRLLEAGFPRPELQISLTDDRGIEERRLDLGYPVVRYAIEYDGEAFHDGLVAEHADRRRRADIARRWGWTVLAVRKNLVLGPSLALELAVGEALSMRPRIIARRW